MKPNSLQGSACTPMYNLNIIPLNQIKKNVKKCACSPLYQSKLFGFRLKIKFFHNWVTSSMTLILCTLKSLMSFLNKRFCWLSSPISMTLCIYICIRICGATQYNGLKYNNKPIISIVLTLEYIYVYLIYKETV